MSPRWHLCEILPAILASRISSKLKMSRALQIFAYITTWTSFLISTASCIIRCYCCRTIKRSWKADDFMSVVVGIFLLGALGLWQQAFSMGCSGPEPNNCNYFDPSGKVLTWFFVTSIIYDAVLHFIIRTSFFTFYWSFSAHSKFRFWIGLGCGMDGMLLIFNVLTIVFRCIPISANFRPVERVSAVCMDPGFALFAPAALNSLLNLYVLVLPIPVFYSIQVPLRRKVHICWMFSIGGAAVVLGFIRMHSLKTLSSGMNTSKAVGETMIVGALGMSLAAIAHNLPSLRVFCKHMSSSRSKITLQRSYDARPRDKALTTTTRERGTAMRGPGSLSLPRLFTASATNQVDRSPAELPIVENQARYPVVNDNFGMRPRTPPSLPYPV